MQTRYREVLTTAATADKYNLIDAINDMGDDCDFSQAQVNSILNLANKRFPFVPTKEIPDLLDANGSTPLIHAVIKCNLFAVQWLLASLAGKEKDSYRPAINQVNKTDFTALKYAVSHEDAGAAQPLTKKLITQREIQDLLIKYKASLELYKISLSARLAASVCKNIYFLSQHPEKFFKAHQVSYKNILKFLECIVDGGATVIQFWAEKDINKWIKHGYRELYYNLNEKDYSTPILRAIDAKDLTTITELSKIFKIAELNIETNKIITKVLDCKDPILKHRLIEIFISTDWGRKNNFSNYDFYQDEMSRIQQWPFDAKDDTLNTLKFIINKPSSAIKEIHTDSFLLRMIINHGEIALFKELALLNLIYQESLQEYFSRTLPLPKQLNRSLLLPPYLSEEQRVGREQIQHYSDGLRIYAEWRHANESSSKQKNETLTDKMIQALKNIHIDDREDFIKYFQSSHFSWYTKKLKAYFEDIDIELGKTKRLSKPLPQKSEAEKQADVAQRKNIYNAVNFLIAHQNEITSVKQILPVELENQLENFLEKIPADKRKDFIAYIDATTKIDHQLLQDYFENIDARKDKKPSLAQQIEQKSESVVTKGSDILPPSYDETIQPSAPPAEEEAGFKEEIKLIPATSAHGLFNKPSLNIPDEIQRLTNRLKLTTERLHEIGKNNPQYEKEIEKLIQETASHANQKPPKLKKD